MTHNVNKQSIYHERQVRFKYIYIYIYIFRVRKKKKKRKNDRKLRNQIYNYSFIHQTATHDPCQHDIKWYYAIFKNRINILIPLLWKQ